LLRRFAKIVKVKGKREALPKRKTIFRPHGPRTEEKICTVDTTSAEEVNSAVRAARVAFETARGDSGKVSGAERGRGLFKFAEIIEANINDVCRYSSCRSGETVSMF
jgi:acyl-CoA reductase-like NAD-dependent aldehyde dehydrogenase